MTPPNHLPPPEYIICIMSFDVCYDYYLYDNKRPQPTPTISFQLK